MNNLGLVWFLCVMAYQPSWLSNAKATLVGRTVVVHIKRDYGLHSFLKGFCPKVNVIERLDFELTIPYDSSIKKFLGESRVLTYFCIGRLNSTAFAEDLNEIRNSELGDTGLAWYSLRAIRRIYIYRWELSRKS